MFRGGIIKEKEKRGARRGETLKYSQKVDPLVFEL